MKPTIEELHKKLIGIISGTWGYEELDDPVCILDKGWKRIGVMSDPVAMHLYQFLVEISPFKDGIFESSLLSQMCNGEKRAEQILGNINYRYNSDLMLLEEIAVRHILLFVYNEFPMANTTRTTIRICSGWIVAIRDTSHIEEVGIALPCFDTENN